MIGFDEAYALTLEAIRPLEAETAPLLATVGRIAAEALHAQVDSPSTDVSLKDGYAVHGADIHTAAADSPISLRLVGSVAAGADCSGVVNAGEAMRILSGAPLPQGADAVIAEEFTRGRPGFVDVANHAEPGRNILARGSDVQRDQSLVSAGELLTPATIGLLAAAGCEDIPVVRRPRVAILATGDEILAPGRPMQAGKLYASNLYTLAAWCLHFGFPPETFVVGDDLQQIRHALETCLEHFDAVLTSGGAWKGEHDLTVRILDELGWRKVYHRVRIGPGKAVGFGIYREKPVFCLPGGPPSNLTAFLQLALPGLQTLAGFSHPGLPEIPVLLAQALRGQPDWTQFVNGCLTLEDHGMKFQPLKNTSRLQMLAHTQAIARIPEGCEEILAGAFIPVQVLP